MERPRGLHDITGKQLIAYNAKHKQRVKEQLAVNSKCHDDRERANVLEGYLARKRRTSLKSWKPPRVFVLARER